MTYSYIKIFMALLVMTAAANAAQPPRDASTLKNSHIEIVDPDKLFKQSLAIFKSLKVSDLVNVYPDLKKYKPHIADVPSYTPLEKVSFLASYEYAEPFLRPNIPLPERESRVGKYLHFLARKHVESLERIPLFTSKKSLITAAERWYWNNALIEYSPMLLLIINSPDKGCIGYLGIRIWQQPGSDTYRLFPCKDFDRDLYEDFNAITKDAGIVPMGDDYLMVMPSNDYQWKTLPGCQSTALDVRYIFRTNGKYVVTLGSGNIYEVTRGSQNILFQLPLKPTIRYSKIVDAEKSPEIAIVPTIFLEQKYCNGQEP